MALYGVEVVLLWLSGWVGFIAYRYWEYIRNILIEPVLKCPVMIFESDDWGPGVVEHAEILEQIINHLSRFEDRTAEKPKMTLGVLLAIADGNKIIQQEDNTYFRKTLDDDSYLPILGAIKRGVEQGVFSIQLHGMEHYWPETLMNAIGIDNRVKQWLVQDDPNTEDLPVSIQSRWIDGGQLPSEDLSSVQTEKAVIEEVATFKHIFGIIPEVVVPPTFIWNQDVENAWVEQGIKVIVTPGCRLDSRDAKGTPCAKQIFPICNGLINTTSKALYLVRDCYFEPFLRHKVEKALADLVQHSELGRPTLFETHRFNFINGEQACQQSLAEIDKLLKGALDLFPSVRFLSSQQLANCYRQYDKEFIEIRKLICLHVIIKRLLALSLINKYLKMSGLYWVLTIMKYLTTKPSMDKV